MSNNLPRRPVHLFLDWDGTLTTRDTMSLLGTFASQRDKRLRGQVSDDVPKPSRPPWSTFGKAYMQDFETHAKDYPLAPEKRNTLAAERAWLESLRTIEEASANRVAAAEYFTDVTFEDIDNAAREAVEEGHLKLRHGWDRLLAALPERETEINGIASIHILSVNWSKTFIGQSLQNYVRLCRESSGDDQERAMLPRVHDNLRHKIQIQANEVTHVSDQGNDGCSTLMLKICTSRDKLLSMQASLLNKDDSVSIYVGDSATDLECLLEADAGICMRDEPAGSSQTELANTLQRLQIEVQHVSEHHTKLYKGLWWAHDFNEVLHFLSSRYNV